MSTCPAASQSLISLAASRYFTAGPDAARWAVYDLVRSLETLWLHHSKSRGGREGSLRRGFP